MKFLACFLLLALAQAAHFGNGHHDQIADKEFLVNQRSIYDLLYHITQHKHTIEYVPFEEFFSSFKDSFTKPGVVTQWTSIVRRGLTPKYKIASSASLFEAEEAKALYYLFFHAKDFETFHKAASWARDNVNEFIFTYSLTMAVRHRPDTREFVLPATYEIFPSLYTSADVLFKSASIKAQGFLTDRTLAEQNGIFSHDDYTYTIANHFSFDFNDEEQKLAYFTNDVGLNYDYFNFYILYPYWLGGEGFGIDSDRRGEIFYWVHQQLLARYTIERYSNGLGDIPKFSWKKAIKTPYNPDTVYHNGVLTPKRGDFFDITEEHNSYDIDDVEDYERRIRDAIYNGYVTLFNGTKYSLTEPEDIEHLGNFIQGNPDFGFIRFYKQFTSLSKFLLGGGINSKQDYVPSALEVSFTTTRDPIFYQFYSRVLHYFYRFKDTLTPYTKKDLFFDGVKVEDVKFTPLKTFFESFTFDITNGVYQTKEEIESRKNKFTFLASQSRLNHLPFSVSVDVIAARDVDATVRIFLGPKFDGYGRKIELNDNRFNFLQIDFFKYELKSGKNTINRKSIEFSFTSPSQTSSRTMYKKFTEAINDKQEFFKDHSENIAAWPYNLLLPKGSKGGQEYQVFVIVTPFRPAKSSSNSNFFQKFSFAASSGGRYHEDLPLGFPFDRTINEVTFFTPNIFKTDVTVYHQKGESPNATFKPYSTRPKTFDSESSI